jgi:hypothetical protein
MRIRAAQDMRVDRPRGQDVIRVPTGTRYQPLILQPPDGLSDTELLH